MIACGEKMCAQMRCLENTLKFLAFKLVRDPRLITKEPTLCITREGVSNNVVETKGLEPYIGSWSLLGSFTDADCILRLIF